MASEAAYYNEIDRQKAEWLRELMQAGVIASGEIDERRIEDVEPADLVGFTQCHFFAGVGVWSYALRLAGWPDTRPVWTGSCPCPSFSAAGKGGGFDDPRHLWPHWARLIRECCPATLFGEQVDDAIGYGWLDLVQTDLEAASYSVGKVVLGACSVGGPHIRQRLYFGAHSERGRCEQCDESQRRVQLAGKNNHAGRSGDTAAGGLAVRGSAPGGNGHAPLADAAGFSPHADTGGQEDRSLDRSGIAGSGSERRENSHDKSTPPLICDAGFGADSSSERFREAWDSRSRTTAEDGLASDSAAVLSADSDTAECETRQSVFGAGATTGEGRRGIARHGSTFFSDLAVSEGLEGHFGDVREWRGPGWLDPHQARSIAATGATGGFWADCDWWYGRDGKYRPAGPGIQPLAHRPPCRVGRLRGYGDAIVAQVAEAFIRSYLEAVGE